MTETATQAYARNYNEAEALIARLQAALLDSTVDCKTANWADAETLHAIVEDLRCAIFRAGDATAQEEEAWRM